MRLDLVPTVECSVRIGIDSKLLWKEAGRVADKELIEDWRSGGRRDPAISATRTALVAGRGRSGCNDFRAVAVQRASEADEG